MNSARIGQRLQDCVRRRRMARSRRPGQHALEPFLERVRHRSLLRHLRAPGGLQMAPPGSIDKLEGHQETLVPNRLRKESADKRWRRRAGDREARREGYGGQLCVQLVPLPAHASVLTRARPTRLLPASATAPPRTLARAECAVCPALHGLWTGRLQDSEQTAHGRGTRRRPCLLQRTK